MNFRFRELPIAIALLAICAFFAVKEPAFLGARNLSMLVTELSITATLAMGMLLILLPGHIDLSAGSGVGLLGGIASVLVFHYHLPAPAALGLGFLCGVGFAANDADLLAGERIGSKMHSPATG